MNLKQKNFQNELNEKGIIIGSFYILNYYGICVFFRVCKTTKHSVYLMELATQRYEDGIMLKDGFKGSKDPYVVLENNTWRKSQYEVFPEKNGCLPIPVEYGSKLYREAENKMVGSPLCGTVYAEPIPYDDLMSHYWLDDIEIVNGNA